MTQFTLKQFKTTLLCIGLVLISIISFNPITEYINESNRQEYEAFLNNHPTKDRLGFDYADIKSKINKRDRPDLAWEQDYLRTINPKTKKIEREKLFSIFENQTQSMKNKAAIPGAASYPWVERGPLSVGGRTRALTFDPNSANKVWAGSVTGGLWFNNDITSTASQWQRVDDFWSNISISAIAFDPNDSQTIYVGTGEGFRVRDSKGAGIWKSTDGGVNWAQLSSTTGFGYIQDLITRNVSGNTEIYAAVGQFSYEGQWFGSTQGLYRSTTDGTSWSEVMPSAGTDNHVPADLDLDGNNNIWVGTTANSYGEGGGKVMSSSDGTTWTTRNSLSGAGRVKIACAPSNGDYIYALFESGSQAAAIRITTNGGSSWSNRTEPDDDDTGIPSSDFTRGQAWYDLAMAVDPNSPGTLLIGGIDVFKSPDGAGSWNQISHWWGGYGHQYVHADIHQIIYKPGSSTEFLIGCDGGVFYSSTGNNTTPTVSERNNRYNVTQFYAGDISPTAGADYFLAGAQDNGTQRFTQAGLANTTEATGGDGGYCFIDQNEANIQITSYVYNSWRVSTDGGVNFNYIQDDQSTGSFINPGDYDYNQNVLFSARTTSTIQRIIDIGGANTINNFSISLGSMASNIKVSPHTAGSSTIFIGTEAGRLFKVTSANTTPSVTEITGGSFPSGNISSIDVGSSEQHLMVTFSNYGVNSIWYSSDGGTSWNSREGDLPDMPIRWCLFNPNNNEEVILATEVGVWSTNTFITTGSPSWISSNSGLANVRVDMLQTRSSDNEVMAATYGRGLFSSTFNDGYNVNFIADQTNVPQATTVNFSDLSTLSTTNWTWSISPATGWIYAGGTDANSQNPQITFNNIGSYTITLDANDGGSNNGTETKTDYIIVSAPSYCDASSTSCDEFFTNVTLEAINNTTGCNNYDDYTTQSADLESGSLYSLLTTLSASYTGDQVAAYIDWNQDADFDDANEELFINNVTTTSNSDDFTVPAIDGVNVKLGETRLRVRVSYQPDDGNITPCGTSTWGEVEDYTVNITSTAGTDITITSSPLDTSIECDDSTDPSNTGQLTATTTCSNTTVNISYSDSQTAGSCVNSYSITRTWTAEDNCGNSEQYAQTITVDDNTKPIIDCGITSDIVISTNGTDATLPNYATGATATDNCTTSPSITQFPAAGSTIALGASSVTLTATDECNNTQTCIISIDVQVNSTISFTVSPADVTIDCTESSLPSNTGQATASSTCTGGATVTYVDNTTSGSCSNEFSITRTWTAEDDCGNSEEYIQTVSIEDKTAPVVTCGIISDTFESINNIDGSVPDYTSGATATDNCTSSLTIAQSPSAGTNLSIGQHTITVSSTDECGNTGFCEITLDIISNGNVGIDDNTALILTSLYPNPSNGEFHVVSPLGNVTIEVYTATGKLIYNSLNDANYNNKVSINDIADGLYYVRLIHNTTSVMKSISIIK